LIRLPRLHESRIPAAGMGPAIPKILNITSFARLHFSHGNKFHDLRNLFLRNMLQAKCFLEIGGIFMSMHKPLEHSRFDGMEILPFS
jgi:hypothetical protein